MTHRIMRHASISPMFGILSGLLLGAVVALARPPTLAIPPEELQTGGEEFFAHLTEIRASFPKFADSLPARAYYDQAANLDLLGEGTSIAVVTDSDGNFIWAISNGRFNTQESNGSFAEGTYPKNVAAPSPVDMRGEHLLGKYTWPRDAAGNYLSGNKLVQSNGPHDELRRSLAIISTLNKGRASEIMAGHVSIGADGKVVIGYLSGQNNNQGTLGDKRALEIDRRASFHQGLLKAFRGRGIEEVVRGAPDTLEEIDRLEARYYFPIRNRFSFPVTPKPPEFELLTADEIRSTVFRLQDTKDLRSLINLSLYPAQSFSESPGVFDLIQSAASGSNFERFVSEAVQQSDQGTLDWLLDKSPELFQQNPRALEIVIEGKGREKERFEKLMAANSDTIASNSFLALKLLEAGHLAFRGDDFGAVLLFTQDALKSHPQQRLAVETALRKYIRTYNHLGVGNLARRTSIFKIHPTVLIELIQSATEKDFERVLNDIAENQLEVLKNQPEILAYFLSVLSQKGRISIFVQLAGQGYPDANTDPKARAQFMGYLVHAIEQESSAFTLSSEAGPIAASFKNIPEVQTAFGNAILRLIERESAAGNFEQLEYMAGQGSLFVYPDVMSRFLELAANHKNLKIMNSLAYRVSTFKRYPATLDRFLELARERRDVDALKELSFNAQHRVSPRPGIELEIDQVIKEITAKKGVGHGTLKVDDCEAKLSVR